MPPVRQGGAYSQYRNSQSLTQFEIAKERKDTSNFCRICPARAVAITSLMRHVIEESRFTRDLKRLKRRRKNTEILLARTGTHDDVFARSISVFFLRRLSRF